MSSRDTNPCCNFYGPHWKLICHNKWHPRTLEISTPLKIAPGTHFPAEHGTNTILVFLPTDGEASWLLLQSSVSLLSGSTVEPEKNYSYILKVISQVWKSQNRISINTNHSYHQRASSEASFNWSNNKIRFSFKQPNRKRWAARLVDVIKHLTLMVFLLFLL